MQPFLKILLAFHIAAGTISLVVAPIAMIVKKGGSQHRLWGKTYFFGMTVVAVTAIIISLFKNIPFLLMVAVFSYGPAANGYRNLFLKKLHAGQKPQLLDWVINSTTLVFNTALIGFGLWLIIADKNNFGIVALVFGGIGCRGAYLETRKFYKTNIDKHYWLYAHIGGMSGAYIATVTAFFVVNVHFLPPLVVWLLPTAVGVPLILYCIKYYKNKLNKGKEVKELVTAKINIDN